MVNAPGTTTVTIHDRYPHLATTYGWLLDDAAEITEDLLTAQTEHGIRGDILEIGVYLGKFFILLARNLNPGESIVGVDIFGTEEPRIQWSANCTYQECLDSLMPHLGDLWSEGRVTLIEQNSVDFAQDVPDEMLSSMRFVSIDGSHDAATAGSDLILAEWLLVPGGIVALDDVNDEEPWHWPGVRQAWCAYDASMRDASERLLEIGGIPNKLLLTNDQDWAQRYRAMLRLSERLRFSARDPICREGM